MKKQILSEEFKRMQKLAGIITESQLNEETLNEALNQDIKIFSQNLEKRFKKAGFDTLVIRQQDPSTEQLNIVKEKPNAVIFKVIEYEEFQYLSVYVNFSKLKEAEKIINYFQLIDYSGTKFYDKKNWNFKQVVGQINPGDIYKDVSQVNSGGVFNFYRLTGTTPNPPRVETSNF